MFGVILLGAGAAGALVNWASSEKSKLDAEEAMAIRTLGGAVAKRVAESGEVEEVAEIQYFPMQDPAFGPEGVFLTPNEMTWWLTASREPEKHLRKIAGILRKQPARRKELGL